MSWSSRPSLPPVALVCLFYFVTYGPPLCICILRSAGFAQLKDGVIVCSSSLITLTASPIDLISCARACREQPDCPSFVFDASSYDPSTGLKVGPCSHCPAHSIAGVNFTVDNNSTLKAWNNVLDKLVNPPTDTFLAIPGALSVGRVVTIRGRIPETLPDRSTIDLFANDMKDIAVRLAPRFDFRGPTNRLAVSTKINSSWSVGFSPDEDFPFSAGGTFEILILAATDGFHVYVDGVYLRHLDKTTFLIGDIGYIHFEKIDIYTVSF